MKYLWILDVVIFVIMVFIFSITLYMVAVLLNGWLL